MVRSLRSCRPVCGRFDVCICKCAGQLCGHGKIAGQCAGHLASASAGVLANGAVMAGLMAGVLASVLAIRRLHLQVCWPMVWSLRGCWPVCWHVRLPFDVCICKCVGLWLGHCEVTGQCASQCADHLMSAFASVLANGVVIAKLMASVLAT